MTKFFISMVVCFSLVGCGASLRSSSTTMTLGSMEDSHEDEIREACALSAHRTRAVHAPIVMPSGLTVRCF